MDPIKIILVDDVQLWRDSFSGHLNSLTNIKVVGAVSEGNELFQIVKRVKFDIVLLDVEIRFGLDGLDTLKKAIECYPDMKIIMLSTHQEPTLVEKCLLLGAKGYLPKDSDIEVIRDCIYRVYNGADYIKRSSEISKNFWSHLCLELNGKFKLTEKEIEILHMQCKGKSAKIIADELDVSERTVQRYITSIYKKTNSKCMAGVISFGIKNGVAW